MDVKGINYFTFPTPTGEWEVLLGVRIIPTGLVPSLQLDVKPAL